MCLYRAIDSIGDTVEFFFSENRDLPAARRFLRKAVVRHGRPDRIVIDGSQTNREAIRCCDAESQYLNNRIEQDHHRIRLMLGFKSEATAIVILAGIEMVHMMRKTTGEVCLKSQSVYR